MGIVSSNISGAPFNGGTITAATVIDTRPDAVTLPLRVRAGDPSTVGFDIQFDPSDSVLRIQGLDNDGGISLTDDFSTNVTLVQSNTIQHTGTGPIVRQDPDFSNLVGLTARGVVCSVHAAPADSSVNAGEAYVWFDQTNGAGKLMVKAKTANGTVATGSVTLT